PSTGILSLSGSGNAADYQEAFRNVRYENINDDPNTSGRNITFVMGDNAIYLESTGHYYESIYSGSVISWTAAKASAEARSLSGMQGYLATILTEEESVFLGSKAPDNAWMGANDVAVEGEWRWVTGPENTTGQGTLFYYQSNGTTLPGFYTNWNDNEPNDFEAGEDCGQILGNSDEKKWNDLPNGAEVYYYLVEYGGMPDETAPQLTAKITVNVNPVNDAPTTPGNFTSPINGQIKQGGQLMTASWGISTDLEDDAVRYDLWFFNGSWTKIEDLLNTNSKTFTLPSDNTNSALLRVYANDTHDNSSARDVTFTIDSLGPMIVYGTNGNNTYSKSHNTTATGTDAVAGLAQISYAWTNDSEMSSVSSWTDFVNGATLAQDTVSGDWYLHINATDNVSNSNYSVSDVFKLDNILPLIHFGTDGNAPYAQSHSTNVTVVDPLSGVQALAYSWTNDPNVSSVSHWT
ncbi:MAG TPA: lectin-like protein, partial [Methanomethylovorans sp.]|nr:lectin-like protein [Methanomethylovorans sp.]